MEASSSYHRVLSQSTNAGDNGFHHNNGNYVNHRNHLGESYEVKRQDGGYHLNRHSGNDQYVESRNINDNHRMDITHMNNTMNALGRVNSDMKISNGGSKYPLIRSIRNDGPSRGGPPPRISSNSNQKII